MTWYNPSVATMRFYHNPNCKLHAGAFVLAILAIDCKLGRFLLHDFGFRRFVRPILAHFAHILLQLFIYEIFNAYSHL